MEGWERVLSGVFSTCTLRTRQFSSCFVRLTAACTINEPSLLPSHVCLMCGCRTQGTCTRLFGSVRTRFCPRWRSAPWCGTTTVTEGLWATGAHSSAHPWLWRGTRETPSVSLGCGVSRFERRLPVRQRCCCSCCCNGIPSIASLLVEWLIVCATHNFLLHNWNTCSFTIVHVLFRGRSGGHGLGRGAGHGRGRGFGGCVGGYRCCCDCCCAHHNRWSGCGVAWCEVDAQD